MKKHFFCKNVNKDMNTSAVTLFSTRVSISFLHPSFFIAREARLAMVNAYNDSTGAGF